MQTLSRSIAVAVAVATWLCTAAHAEPSAPPAVIVTSKPAHALVASVMQGIAAPGLLVDGASSPHSYALRPSQTRQLQGADVFVRVSATTEPFSEDLIRTLPAKAEVVSLDHAPGVKRLALRAGAAFEADGHDHDHDHDHDAAPGHGGQDAGGALDGHIWLDPDNAKAIVAHVAGVLARRDPVHAAGYRDNAASTLRRIDELAATIERRLSVARARPFVVFHDATQYFEKRFGLTAVGAIQLAPHVPPSAKRLSDVRARIVATQASCVFAEPWLTSHIVETATEGTAARVGVIDPEGTALPAGPELYFTLMGNTAASMADCLGR